MNMHSMIPTTHPTSARSAGLHPAVSTAAIAAACLGALLAQGSAQADDITPIVMWGADVDAVQTPPDPRYVDVFSAIALGDAHGLAILAPGRAVRGWGRNTFGQTTVPVVAGVVTYTALAAGTNHSAALRSDGAIVCVGANDFGQCDVDVIALAYTKVRCGSNFTLGVDLNGDVHAWGDDAAGQSTVPVGAVRTFDLAAGRDHVALLTDSGDVVFWGDNTEGEQTQPTLGAGQTVAALACGWDTTAFLLSDGTVQVVGDNTLLQQSVPALGTGETYSSLRAHGYTLGALRSDGEIVVWGNTSNDLDEPPAAPLGTVYEDFQLGFGFAGALFNLDCDDDGDSDLDQIAADSDLDCNIDNRIDSCEEGSLLFSSSTVAPFASGSTVTLAFEDVSDAVTDVMVEVEVKADLGSPSEYLTLAFNGQVIDYVFPSGGANCPASFQKETIFIPAAMFNEMLEDGDATFTLSASSLVSQAECATSAAKMRVSYLDDSADCNGNGTPDSCELADGDVSDMNGDGIPDTCQLTPVGDIDGDRKGDVLWFNPTSREFSAWFMNGLTRTAGGYVGENAPTGFSIGGVGDLDGDGRTDVVLRNPTTGAVRGMLLAGTALAESGPISGVVPSDYRLLAMADIDGDGNDDILWKSATTGKVFGWRMHGLARLTSGEIGDTTGLQFLGAGDLDADGDADILWRDTANTVRGWLLDGLTITTNAAVADAGPVFSDWSPTGMADLNGDGKADLLWRNTTTGQLNGWFMNGLTKSSGGPVSTTVGLTYGVAALVDLDGDSKSDILWRNNANGDVNAWLMDGLTRRTGAFIRSASLDWRIINP